MSRSFASSYHERIVESNEYQSVVWVLSTESTPWVNQGRKSAWLLTWNLQITVKNWHNCTIETKAISLSEKDSSIQAFVSSRRILVHGGSFLRGKSISNVFQIDQLSVMRFYDSPIGAWVKDVKLLRVRSHKSKRWQGRSLKSAFKTRSKLTSPRQVPGIRKTTVGVDVRKSIRWYWWSRGGDDCAVWKSATRSHYPEACVELACLGKFSEYTWSRYTHLYDRSRILNRLNWTYPRLHKAQSG